MMNRSPFPSVKYGSVSPNRFPFCSIANGKVLPNSADWSWPEASNKRGCHEKENHKTTPFKTILTPLWKRDCSPLHSSPSPRTTDEWSSHSEDEMSCVSLTDIEIVHARLDPSVSCSLCGASHTLYLMYPLIKTLDTWNESSKFLCSLCFAEEENRQDVGSSLPSDDTAPKPRAVAKRQQYRKTNTALISKSTCQVQPCLDVLHSVEDELELVATALSQDYRPPQDASTCRELPNQGQVEETKIHEELHSSNGHLQRHWDLLTDTVTVLQAALDQEGDDECDVLLAYYQWRERHRRDDTSSPAWKTQADRALDQRDNVVGVGPGHFWGGKLVLESVTENDGKSKISETTTPKSKDDLIEELATLRESQVYQIVLPARRGLGWSTCKPYDQAEEADAYEAEAITPCIPRSEHQDRTLTRKEHYRETRTSLVLVEEDDSGPDPSSPERLSNGFASPRIIDSMESSSASSQQFSPPLSSKETIKRASEMSSESTLPSFAPAKRAKRRCLRCVKFDGLSPSRCRGSKGRWGQKGCEYFTSNGTKMK